MIMFSWQVNDNTAFSYNQELGSGAEQRADMSISSSLETLRYPSPSEELANSNPGTLVASSAAVRIRPPSSETVLLTIH
jgi:hypothetical protein